MDSNTDMFEISGTRIPVDTEASESEASEPNSPAELGETLVEMDEILENIVYHQKETNKVSL